MRIIKYDCYRREEILPLYQAVGWTNYTARPNMVDRAFENSDCVLGAWEGDRLVGFLRAVGDGASILYVQDIVVHPAFQRKGIGSSLLKELIQRYPDVYQTVLMTDNTEKTSAFYRSCGFTSGEEWGCRCFMRIVSP